MADFTSPPPGNKPGKIAPTIPLAKADKERQELYGPLVEGLAAGESDPLPKPASEPVDESPQPPEPTEELPSEEDRQVFLASVLGHKAYEKEYVLFGAVKVLFRDRTPREVELIQSVVNQLPEMSDVELAIQEERFVLAAQLARLAQPSEVKPYEPVTVDTLRNRADDLLSFPKPMYQALLDSCREFDRHVSQLTRHALDKDFWPAGTANLPSSRTAPAPSTSPASAAATHTGR